MWYILVIKKHLGWHQTYNLISTNPSFQGEIAVNSSQKWIALKILLKLFKGSAKANLLTNVWVTFISFNPSLLQTLQREYKFAVGRVSQFPILYFKTFQKKKKMFLEITFLIVEYFRSSNATYLQLMQFKSYSRHRSFST